MKKHFKKGFTLIELLAVIIVLAVVALIAIPIALDVIQESKDSANKTTAYNIIDAAKLYYSESMFDESKKENINNKNNIYKSITMSNEIPESGELYVNKSGKVALSVVIDNKCYIKYFESELQIYDEKDEKCNSYINEDKIAPKVTFEIIGTLGENDWYKLNDNGTDTLYVKINTEDIGSGISYYNWCTGINCTPTNKETENLKSISILDTEGTQICVEAFDNYGNTSGVVCSKEIKKDTEAPIAGTVELAGTKGENDWYISDVTIQPINGDDDLSGHSSTEVDIMSIQQNTSGTKVTVTTTDKAGNKTTREYLVKVDKDKPELSEVVGTDITETSSKEITVSINKVGISDLTKFCYYVSDTTISSTQPIKCIDINNLTMVTFNVTTPGKYIFFEVKNEAGSSSGVSEAYNLNVIDLVYETPKMTSNTTCADETNPLCGKVIASSEKDNHLAYTAFDGNVDILNGWMAVNATDTSNYSEYLTYEFNNTVRIKGYKFFLYDAAGHGCYDNFNSNIKVEYSLDGNSWSEIENTILSAGTEHTINFEQSYTAKYFRITITGYNSNFVYTTSGYWIGITEMSIIGSPVY